MGGDLTEWAKSGARGQPAGRERRRQPSRLALGVGRQQRGIRDERRVEANARGIPRWRPGSGRRADPGRRFRSSHRQKRACLQYLFACKHLQIKKPDLIPPAPEELTQTLARDLLEFVNQLFTAGQRDLFAAIEEAGVSITQVKALRALAEVDEPMSLGAVSETLGLSLAAISRSVDALVRRGFVKREEDPRDRRSKLVTVTGRGRST